MLGGFLIRVLAFVRKELFVALRQPRVILSLVVGPFLILALFGLSYKGITTYKTVLVVPNQEGVSTNPQDYNNVIYKQTFKLEKVVKNEQEALDILNNRDADVVIVIPANTLDEIYNGRQAKFPVYLRNLSPIQSDFVKYSVYTYASELNRYIVERALAASKPQSKQIEQVGQQMNSQADVLDSQMKANNAANARLQAQTMAGTVAVASSGLDGLILPGTGDAKDAQQNLLNQQLQKVVINQGIGQLRSDLDNIKAKLDALNAGFEKGDANSAQQRANLDSMRQSINSFNAKTGKVAAIPPDVLSAPIQTRTSNLAATEPSYTNFYGPAVIILLLQHVAVTLTALSIVRDRMIGAIETFRVAPISPGQILTGKFLSFAVLLTIIVTLLLVLVTQALGVPIVNFATHWFLVVAVLAVTIYASIGLGFLIAGLSRNESQVTQLSVLLLLASIFFTGFVVPLSQFSDFMRYAGYILPMTFGADGLQSVMLDSRPLDPLVLIAPAILGTVYILLGLLLYRRQFKIA